MTLDEIHDIHGLRLIVEKEEDCFEALTVVHQLWSQVSGKFENYINRPKLNGYVKIISQGRCLNVLDKYSSNFHVNL